MRRARRFLRSDTERFRLRPGRTGSAGGLLRRVPPAGSFYGGLLFEATPIEDEMQIREILRLNASVLLDPPPELRRVRLGAETLRAEQPAGRSIRVLMPVINRGNAYSPARAGVIVRDAAGEVRLRLKLGAARILPGAVVELQAPLRAPLEAGVYRIFGRARMAEKSVRARGMFEISESGDLVFNDAELAGVPAPAPERGEPAEIEARYLNTGNTSFVPTAEAIVTQGGAERERAPAPQALSAEPTEAGAEGSISGAVELAGDATSYELELRLLDGERLLDSRTVSVSPQPRRGSLDELEDWVRRNAVVLVLALLALLLLLVTLLARGRGEPSKRGPPSAEPGADDAAKPKAELATVSYEDLRGLGLTVDQALAVVEHRLTRGLTRVDQLREVPGLPAAVVAELARRLHD